MIYANATDCYTNKAKAIKIDTFLPDRQTDGGTERQTDRQSDSWEDAQTDGGRQIDRYICIFCGFSIEFYEILKCSIFWVSFSVDGEVRGGGGEFPISLMPASCAAIGRSISGCRD